MYESNIGTKKQGAGEEMKRRSFGLRSKEATGGWRELHKKELHNLYILPNIVRVVTSNMR
jgi:hypothetical protein